MSAMSADQFIAARVSEYSGEDDRSFRLNVTDYSG
jgi:hypothetical protein